ncbi:MAG: LIC11966 family surface protein [Bacteroidota bacterium]
MKKLAFFSTMVLGLFLLISCGSSDTNGGQTPLEYNNQIISEQTKIMNLILEFGRNNSQDVNVIDGIRLKIVDQAEKSLKVVKAMEGYDGSTRMKEAAVALFSLYHDASKTSYKEMIDILKKGEDISVEDVERIQQIQMELTEKEKPLDAEFQAAQKEFATKHKLMIQDNPLQQEIDNMGE